MIITVENKFGITNEQINIPFMVNNVPIGIVTNATDGEITVLIWDRFVGIEKEYETSKNILDTNTKSKITAICVGDKLSDNAKMNMFGIS